MLTEPALADIAADATGEAGLHQTVARIAVARPNATALRCGPRAVSYAELDRTADAWSAALIDAGAGPDGIVPILLPRGVELVIALLAVLKTGAAYALLDPAWPPSRISDVIRQLDACLLVTGDPSMAERLEPPMIPWTPPRGPVASPAAFRPAEVDGAAACCVFFTSGTTGRPKGVLSPHRATARLFRPGSFAHFGPASVVPLAAPVPWDAFSLELWSALLNGGCSLIVEEAYLTPGALRGAVREYGADTVWLTSSLFNMVVDEDLGAFAGLDQLMTGGERLSTGHVRRFLNRYPEITLLNGYGPVESTVFATTHRITAADCETPGGIPVGRAVPRTGVHILDDSRLCTPGEVGEICISGEGLALGYLGDPGLTAAKFPVLTVDGADTRVYRTGDLGYRDRDGVIRYRGRADRQVKIRGHRVEPAEVERGVERLPTVRACRVVARLDETGAVRELLAFCVPAEPGDSLERVAPLLADLLPSYQRPAAVVSVPAFPLTAQGKLDERALLELVADGPATRTAPTGTGPDRTADPMERLLAEVFQSILELPWVPGDASFFDLGGTSLAAGRVCARLSERLDRPVELSALYKHPSARELAAWLRASATEPRPTTSAADDAESAPVPLSPIQLVYLARQLSDPGDQTSHCLLTWVLDGPLDQARLQTAVDEVHRRHGPLRTAYLVDPTPVAELTDIGPPLVELLPGQPSVDEALRAARTVLADELDPTAADVWRVILAPVAGTAVHVLGCAVHHVAFDGWSEAVLANDLSAAYNGEVLPPAPPTAAALHRSTPRRSAADEAASRESARAELAGVPDLFWPSGPGGGPADRGAVGDVIAVELPPRTLGHIDAVAAEARVSRFAALFSRWAAVLAETTGQRDFAVGVPVARRERPGLEHAIGCHITVLCLRARGGVLRGNPDGARAAARTYAHALTTQDLPFAELLRAAGTRSTGRPPLFQTMFAVQDNAVAHLTFDGLASSFVRQPYLDVPLELHGELWPTGDGGLLLTVFYRLAAVTEATAREIAERFTDPEPRTRKASL